MASWNVKQSILWTVSLEKFMHGYSIQLENNEIIFKRGPQMYAITNEDQLDKKSS